VAPKTNSAAARPRAGPKDKARAKGKLLILDVSSLLFRAFFALPEMSNARGEPTGAVYGFASMLVKLLDEEQPTAVAACLDLPGPTFRHELSAEYKATRPELPEALEPQFDDTRSLLEALRIPIFAEPGLEADDLIGSVSDRASAAGYEVVIVSGDLDTLQLIQDGVSVLAHRRGFSDLTRYDAQAVLDRFGLPPDRIPDFKALRGDTSDNVKGVPGIGEKTAAKLLQQFPTVEALFDHLDQLEDRRLAAKLAPHKEAALLSKRLVTIQRDHPLNLGDSLDRTEPDRAALLDLFHRLEFRSLAKRFAGDAPLTADYRLGDAAETAALTKAARAAGRAAVAVAVSDGDPVDAELRGVAVSIAPAAAVFFAGADAHALLRDLLTTDGLDLVAANSKALRHACAGAGIPLAAPPFDVALAAALLDAGGSASLATAAYRFLSVETPSPPRLAGDDDAPGRACVAADFSSRLAVPLRAALAETGQTALYDDIEAPLVAVLVAMERHGVLVDAAYLDAFAAELRTDLDRIRRDAFTLAGHEFNLDSPKQLQQVLFDELGLPKRKKTKTGWSTDADVLQALAADHEIVAIILRHRELAKLLSTYVEALPRMMNARTGRVHTIFEQIGAATGRISSREPNLQNVPVRTDLGKRIRRAVIAPPGATLLSADYSQIELRILAHISGDAALHRIFEDDLDLHAATAAEIYGVSLEQVTSQMRAVAKMVNYGIPYGMGPQRLARELGLSMAEAQALIDRYFVRFAGVAKWCEEVVEQAGRDGFVITLLGRRRPIADLHSGSRPQREFARRVAINTPIQGSAADLLKLAMLKTAAALRRTAPAAAMVLTVHDELVFEVPTGNLASVAVVVRDTMSSAYPLRVPVTVDLQAGPNWCDMETVA